MNALGQIAHLLATDPAFRLAFLSNQDEAITARGLALDAEGKAALANIRQRLVASPRELAGRLLASPYVPTDWGGLFSNDVKPAPQLL